VWSWIRGRLASRPFFDYRRQISCNMLLTHVKQTHINMTHFDLFNTTHFYSFNMTLRCDRFLETNMVTSKFKNYPDNNCHTLEFNMKLSSNLVHFTTKFEAWCLQTEHFLNLVNFTTKLNCWSLVFHRHHALKFQWFLFCLKIELVEKIS